MIIEVYLIYNFLPILYPLLSLLLIFWSINNTALVKLNQNTIGIIVNHQVPPMIIVDNKRNNITNLLIITNVNSIAMIEKHINIPIELITIV